MTAPGPHWAKDDTNEQPIPAPRMNAATLARYQHEERMAQATRPPRDDKPYFEGKRSTASGTAGLMGFEGHVPVCDEYPTAEEAFAALIDFTERWNARFPLPDGRVQPTASQVKGKP